MISASEFQVDLSPKEGGRIESFEWEREIEGAVNISFAKGILSTKCGKIPAPYPRRGLGISNPAEASKLWPRFFLLLSRRNSVRLPARLILESVTSALTTKFTRILETVDTSFSAAEKGSDNLGFNGHCEIKVRILHI